MKPSRQFGALFKGLRLKKGYTLREYCRTYDYDPAYISRIERGKTAPPLDSKALRRFALSLGLKENTNEFSDFVTLASVCAGRIPEDVMSDEELLGALPVLLRTTKGQQLTEDRLDALIEEIKKT